MGNTILIMHRGTGGLNGGLKLREAVFDRECEIYLGRYAHKKVKRLQFWRRQHGRLRNTNSCNIHQGTTVRSVIDIIALGYGVLFLLNGS